MVRSKTSSLMLAAAALTLGACSEGTTAAPVGSSAAAPSSSAPVTTATPVAAQASVPRCTTDELALSLGTMTQTSTGQDRVPLVYTNVSTRSCDLYGVPGVDLVGPDHPMFGPTYSLPRVDNGEKSDVLKPGARGAATLWLLQQDGPDGWVPNEIVSIPPGQTTALRVAWPFRFGVLRQDAATHPGTYVHGITSLN